MNVLPTTTAAPILANDLGKYKNVAGLYDPATAHHRGLPAPRWRRSSSCCPGAGLPAPCPRRRCGNGGR